VRRSLLLSGAILAAGCSALAPDPASRALQGAEGKSISLRELEQRTKNFADRYIQLLGDAVERIKESPASVKARREAHLLKLRSATSAWDVVTSSHPAQEMLDLFVQVELQLLMWVDEGLAGRTFGPEGGERLAQALRSAREEILALARHALPDDKIAGIQGLVRDWRKRNPNVETGAFIRFGPYLDAPGGTLVSQLLSGFGLLDLSKLNPLDPAAKQVKNVGHTADDAFYMSKRFPMLLEWQAEAATFDILQALDQTSANTQGTLKSGESLLRNATETAKALQGTFEALAKVTTPDKAKDDDPKKEGPPARPFDVRDYEATAAQVERTAREARGLLVDVRDLAESSAVTARVHEIGEQMERLLAQLLVEALLLLIVFFTLLTIYRAVSLRLRERHARETN
jgi:hypothetical protein